jgi:hypothetical protein
MVDSSNLTITFNVAVAGIATAVVGGVGVGNLTISATPNGLSLTGQELALQLASATQTGALSDTDWNTFNEKVSTATLATYNTVSIENITLLVANWALVSGLYEYDYADALILADSVVEVIPYDSTIQTVKDSEILPMVISSTGTVKIKAKYVPTDDILIAINITK